MSQGIESSPRGKWLFLIIAWVLYSIIAILAILTHQSRGTLDDILGHGFAIMVIVTFLVLVASR